MLPGASRRTLRAGERVCGMRIPRMRVFLFSTLVIGFALLLMIWSRIMSAPSPTRRLGRDGGAHAIFVDVGGNVGDSVAAFLSVGVPGIRRPPTRFDAVHVFEPNPAFHAGYDRYRNHSYAFELLAAAAGGRNGWTTFSGEGLGG